MFRSGNIEAESRGVSIAAHSALYDLFADETIHDPPQVATRTCNEIETQEKMSKTNLLENATHVSEKRHRRTMWSGFRDSPFYWARNSLTKIDFETKWLAKTKSESGEMERSVVWYIVSCLAWLLNLSHNCQSLFYVTACDRWMVLYEKKVGRFT